MGMGNLFNSAGGLQGLGLLLGSMSNQPDTFGNLFNTTLMMDEKEKAERKEQSQNAAVRALLGGAQSQTMTQPDKVSFDADGQMTNTPQAPVTQNLMSSGNRDQLMATALGPQNLLMSKLAAQTKANEPIKVDAGGSIGHYAGNKFVTDYTAPTKPEAVPDNLQLINAYQNMDPADPRRAMLKLLIDKQAAPADKTNFKKMSPAEVAQWGLPVGTIAAMGSNGKPEIVGKPAGQDFLTEFGVTPDSTPDDIRESLSATNKGKNLLTQAQAVLDGKDQLGKMNGRVGANEINQLRSVVYALDPSYNPLVGQARQQMNKEFTNLSGVNAPGSRIASASKLINHSIDLLDNAADLENGKLNAANWGKNLTSGQIAGRRQTALRALQTSTEGVGSEFEKVMGGGIAGVEARKGIERKLNVNDNVTGLLGTVGSIVNLMEGQITPLVDAHNSTFNRKDGLDAFVSPEVVRKLEVVKGLLADSKAGRPITPATVRAALNSLKSLDGGGSQAMAVPNEMDSLLNKYAPR